MIELPHEQAAREVAAVGYSRDWTPDAALLARTADLAGISPNEAESVLRQCVAWKGGLEAALSAAAMGATKFDDAALLYRYETAVKNQGTAA